MPYVHKKVFAYIDGANLYEGIKNLGKNVDYGLFRKWLTWKYRVDKAYIFIGYIPQKESLYDYLKASGFILVFKETICQKGVIKGNADAEMVLQSVKDFYEEHTEEAIVISGDGDFSCLVDFLQEKNVLKTLIIPNKKYSSYLLRKKTVSKVFLDDIRLDNKFIKKRKST